MMHVTAHRSLAIAVFLLLGILMIAALCDLKWHRIPNRLNLAGVTTALGLSLLCSLSEWSGQMEWYRSWVTTVTVSRSLAGLVLAGLLPLLLYVAGSGGAGDVKLAWVMGGFLGSAAGCQSVILGYLLAGIWGLFVFIWSGRCWAAARIYLRSVGYRLWPQRVAQPSREEWGQFSNADPMAPFLLAGTIVTIWA